MECQGKLGDIYKKDFLINENSAQSASSLFMIPFLVQFSSGEAKGLGVFGFHSLLTYNQEFEISSVTFLRPL